MPCSVSRPTSKPDRPQSCQYTALLVLYPVFCGVFSLTDAIPELRAVVPPMNDGQSRLRQYGDIIVVGDSLWKPPTTLFAFKLLPTIVKNSCFVLFLTLFFIIFCAI